MKKLLALLLAAMIPLSVAGCGNGGSGGASKAKGEPIAKDTKATLTYVSWNSNQKEQNEATIKAFQKEYPNIKIELSYSTWDEYWNKLEAAATGNNLADIITMHTNTIAKYVNAGYMADLTNLDKYDKDFSFDKHPEDVKKLYRFNDKYWGVPKDFDCIVLIYNKDLFDAKGVAYPTNEWTWNDLEAAATTLTDKANNQYGFGARNDEQGGWASFLYQGGGGILTEDGKKAAVDDPKSIEAMKWYYNMYENYSPSQNTYAEAGDAYAVFKEGNLAMQTIGNWELSYYMDDEKLDGKWDVTALPAGKDGTRATIMNGLAISTPAKGKNIDAAMQFLAYFGTEQGQMDAAMGPSIPCYEGVSDEWAKLNEGKFSTSAVLDQMQFGVQWIGTEMKTQWDKALLNHMDNIYTGKDIETELKAAAKEMNEILAKEK